MLKQSEKKNYQKKGVMENDIRWASDEDARSNSIEVQN